MQDNGNTAGGEDTRLRYWLTVFKHGKRCVDCAEGPYEVLAYRPSDQHAICLLCQDLLGIDAQPSKRYLAWKQHREAKDPNRQSSIAG